MRGGFKISSRSFTAIINIIRNIIYVRVRVTVLGFTADRVLDYDSNLLGGIMVIFKNRRWGLEKHSLVINRNIIVYSNSISYICV
jgi:hypothetical protein